MHCRDLVSDEELLNFSSFYFLTGEARLGLLVCLGDCSRLGLLYLGDFSQTLMNTDCFLGL